MAIPQHEGPERLGSGVSYPGVALVVALLAGAVLLPQLPLIGTRPAPDEAEVRYRHLVAEQALARLWEDPLSAVARHKQSEKERASKDLNTDGASADHHQRPEIGKPSRKEIVVTVMVPGGPYPEDVEARVRFRSAVLAGLRVSRFTPQDAEHILFYHPKREKLPEKVKLPETVPYEWFHESADADQSVLLLWLDENALTRPLQGIVELYRDLMPTSAPTPKLRIIGPASSTTLSAMLNEVTEVRDPTQEKRLRETLRNVEFYSAVATVPDKQLLASLHQPPDRPRAQSVSTIFSRFDSQFFRTSPTDDLLIQHLIQELKLRRVDPVCGDRRADCYRDLPTQYCGRLHHIALISEWDTFYGRALPQTFADYVSDGVTAAAPDDLPGCGVPNWIHRFSYLRGLDGQLPGLRSASDTPASNNGPRKTEDAPRGNTKMMERPIGRSQFDYLRRLAGQVQQLDQALKRDNEGEIKAIGILGSDVYDKFLVLQALRAQFPNAIFFTTDADALFLHPDEWQYTRNLLVASAFGLQLAPTLQQDIPPFRGSYQTAMFFATLVALRNSIDPTDSIDPADSRNKILLRSRPQMFKIGPSGSLDRGVAPSPQNEEGEKWLLPRMYEIGRSQLVDLTDALDRRQTNGEGGQWWYPRLYQLGRQRWVAPHGDLSREDGKGTKCDPDKPAYACLKGLNTIHPARAPSVPDGSMIKFFLLGTLLVFALAYASSWYVRRTTTSAVHHVGIFLKEGGTHRWIGLTLLVVVLMLFMEGIARIIVEGDRGEPFAIFEGVSVWPTESLRLVAAILSVVFTLMVWFERDFDTTTERFFPTAPPTTSPLDARRKTLFKRWKSFSNKCRIDIWKEPISNDEVDAQRLWEDLTFRRRPRCRLYRIVLMLLAYFLVAFYLGWIFGRLSTPCRGETCFLLDTTILIVSVVCVSFLLFSVVDSIRLHTQWSTLLSSKESKWPRETLIKFNQRFNFDNPTYLNDWLDVDLIAERSEAIGRQIYYPVIVLFLMIAARYPLFDDWKAPIGLVIVMGLSVLYLVSVAYLLRRAAERCRQDNLDRLWKKLVSVTGQGAKAAPLKEQLEMLTREIMAIQRGAFRPLGQQPVLRAVLLLLGGSGGLVILQYLPLLNL
jgi:hypothetical protein